MIRKKLAIIGISLVTLAGIMMSSCTKNDENTIVPIGTEYYIDDILSVIPDTLQTAFFAAFGDVPSGAIPPKIEGSYVVDPKQRVGSNMAVWPLNTIEPVCGSGNNFAVYFIETKDYDLGWMKRGVLMRGKVTADGLSDFRYATVVMETEDHSGGQFGLYPTGTYFIYKDGDGLASNLDW